MKGEMALKILTITFLAIAIGALSDQIKNGPLFLPKIESPEANTYQVFPEKSELLSALTNIQTLLEGMNSRLDSLDGRMESLEERLGVLEGNHAADRVLWVNSTRYLGNKMKKLSQNIRNSSSSSVSQQEHNHRPLKEENTIIGSTTDKPNDLPSADLNNKDDVSEQEEERKQFIHSFVTSPKARLYSELNYTGTVKNYNFQDSTYEGGCQDVDVGGTWKSADPLNGCIRLFYYRYCMDRSLALYPGSSITPSSISAQLPQVWSVGPCLQSEFDFSAITPTNRNSLVFTKNTSNFQEIPDLVDISGEEYYSKVTNIVISSSGTSIRRYLQQQGTRKIKYLYAEIQRRHFKLHPPHHPIPNLKRTAGWSTRDTKAGDEPGFVIPPNLSGPTNESCNIFPQSRGNARAWKRVTDQIPGIFLQYPESYVEVRVTFSYENEVKTRPYGFYYHLIFGNKKVLYGFLRN